MTGTDSDLLLDRILGFAGAVVVILATSAVVSWLVFQSERRRLTALDPPPSPIFEANLPTIPPDPRLQTDPPADMRALHARERAILEGHGWSSERSSTIRIPIHRAMDLYLEKGARPALSDEETGAPPAGGGEK